MVTDTRKRNSGIDKKDVEKSIELGNMSTVGVDQTLPILIQRDGTEQVKFTHSDNSGTNYLHLLIESYKDQIELMRKELDHKNDIITNLIQIVKGRQKNVAIDNEVCSSVAKLDIQNNTLDMQHNTPEVLSDRGCDRTNAYDGLWNYPKKPAKISAKSADIAPPTIVDQNRYASLRDSQWLTPDNDPDFDRQSNTSSNASNTKQPGKSRPKKKRTITIAGDSMLGGIKQWKMRKLIPQNNVHLKCFPGATTSDMADYIRPTMRREPDVCLIHVGTNDLRSEMPSEKIADSIMDLATKMKSSENEIIVSSIISRGDRLNEKARLVNEHLMSLCIENDICYLDNSNICVENLERGGAWGGIHLNDSGTELFKRNILDILEI